MGLKNYIRKLALRLKLVKKDTIRSTHYVIDITSFARDSTIGDYTYISPHTFIHSSVIGKFCSIGPNTVIGYGEHPIHFISTSPLFYHSELIFDKTFAAEEKFNRYETVFIGNDVWIGANVFIKNGITIGDGCVIGAGAVVIKDIPPYSVVGGVPAYLIKTRFPPDVIEELLKIKWWDWEDKELQKNQHYFITNDINIIRNFINGQKPR